MIKLFDKIKLKTGEIARVVEILEPEVAFMADIAKEQGGYYTDTIKASDVSSVFVETEQPYTPVIRNTLTLDQAINAQ
jgi:hypothetical protein